MNEINLIPVNSTGTWTYECGKDYTAYVGLLGLQGNYWNAECNGTSGTVDMSINGGLRTIVNLTKAKMKNPNLGVLGYPETIYGYKPFGRVRTAINQKLPLPLTTGDLPNAWINLEYEVVNHGSLRMNFSFDLWLTRGSDQAGIFRGDLELMIWLYHFNLRPAGLPEGTIEAPILVNNAAENAKWEVWFGDTGQWNILTLRLANPLKVASVSLPLRGFIEKALSIVSGKLINITGYYLNGLEVGTEYGPVKNGEAVQLEWIIHKYTIRL
ncbi:GH12 family glycosyl hydrolase domain-containing protein [Caldivirga sp.]|uniref:GH12 family glycosyl hydrolase domain-containing protein n=1 Tax=Caldivirga sp. TaxID=2080243 RepID=UPI003D1055AB